MSLAAAAVAAAVPGAIAAPSIEYSQLAPMLVVFGAAVVGVLVEAFAPRELRRPIHLLVTFGALVAAFVWTCVIAASSTIFAHGSAGHSAAEGAVAVDRPTLFIQGTILVLAAVAGAADRRRLDTTCPRSPARRRRCRGRPRSARACCAAWCTPRSTR